MYFSFSTGNILFKLRPNFRLLWLHPFIVFLSQQNISRIVLSVVTRPVFCVPITIIVLPPSLSCNAAVEVTSSSNNTISFQAIHFFIYRCHNVAFQTYWTQNVWETWILCTMYCSLNCHYHVYREREMPNWCSVLSTAHFLKVDERYPLEATIYLLL